MPKPQTRNIAIRRRCTSKTTMSPCRCEEPGPGRRRQIPLEMLGDYVYEQQYDDRRRLGLPIETDTEKGIRKRWHSG